MLVPTGTINKVRMNNSTKDVVSTNRGAATDSGPPGQHIHSGPPAFRGGGDCVPQPVFFSPSPKSDYTVSAIKIVQFCM